MTAAHKLLMAPAATGGGAALLSEFVFATRPTIAETDLANGDAAYVAKANWSAGVSSSTSTSYISFAQSTALQAIGNEYTMVWVGSLSSITGSSKLICIPYRNGSWSNPFGAMTLGRQGAGTVVELDYAVSSSSYAYQLTTSGFDTSVTSMSARRNGATVEMVRNGSLLTNGSGSGLGSTAPDLVNNQDVTLHNRSSSATGEGVAGTCLFAGIAGRWLDDAEIATIVANPTTFS